jgi:hypothetical protein
MTRVLKLAMILAATVATLTLAAATPPNVSAGSAATHVDWDAVGAAIGVTGSAQAAGVERYDLPRPDLKVMIGKVRLKPAFALGGYLVFLPMAGTTSAMMMGDLVLAESEIERVMLKLEQGGVDVTAIHNHLLWEKPSVKYMHVEAMGDAVHFAQVVHDALATTKTPLRTAAASSADQQVDLDTASLDQAIGVAGKVSGGTYKFSIAPKYTVTSGGMTVPASMGTSTAFAFQPLGKGKAAITGDFALLGPQVNPVIRALRANGIFVTALHSHMIDSQPTVFFMHFFATGGATALARGLRVAVDSMASA